MEDLDRTGDKYTWGPRKIELSPKYFEIGMEGGAQGGKDAFMESNSRKYSSSVKGLNVLKFDTDSLGTCDSVIT